MISMLQCVMSRTIKAPLPDDTCHLSVSAMHPELGPFFMASFRGRRSRSAVHSDEAGLQYLFRHVPLPWLSTINCPVCLLVWG